VTMFGEQHSKESERKMSFSRFSYSNQEDNNLSEIEKASEKIISEAVN